MRGTEPSTLKAKGIAAYPERVELSLALYLQDYLVSLGEPKQFNEKRKENFLNKFVKSIDKFYKLVYNAVTVKKGENKWQHLLVI